MMTGYLLAMIPTFILGFLWGFILCSVNDTYQRRKREKNINHMIKETERKRTIMDNTFCFDNPRRYHDY
jgi:hypothetical protein